MAKQYNQSCPVAKTLEVIGDPWTLLVIRDAFNGVSRFEQWQERLGAGFGWEVAHLALHGARVVPASAAVGRQ